MTVFCAGTFDLLHVGHINLLLFCRQQAGHNGKVIMSIDSDKKIKKDKGDDRPIFKYTDRLLALESIRLNNLRVVDLVIEHPSNEYLLDSIKLYKPDAIVVGGDYQDKEVIGSGVSKVIYYPRDYRFSSSGIIEAIKRKL